MSLGEHRERRSDIHAQKAKAHSGFPSRPDVFTIAALRRLPRAPRAPLALPVPGSLELGKALLGHVRRFGFWIHLYDVLKRPAGRFDIHEFYLAIGHRQ